jgi:ferredoxin
MMTTVPDRHPKDTWKGKAMAKIPWVDEEVCISCGLCVENVPGVFRIADNGKAECFDPGGATEEEIQSGAIDVCPVECIHWKE